MAITISTLTTKIAALESRPVYTPPPTTTTPPTTTSPPTTTAPTVGNSVSLNLTTFGTPSLSGAVTTAQTIVYSLKYTNSANVSFSNVKFQLILITTIPAGAITSVTNLTLTTIGAPSPIWILGAGAGVGGLYTLTSIPSITIAPNSSGELIISLSVTWNVPPPAGTYQVFPTISIV
jgi:hypothetical protein